MSLSAALPSTPLAANAASPPAYGQLGPGDEAGDEPTGSFGAVLSKQGPAADASGSASPASQATPGSVGGAPSWGGQRGSFEAKLNAALASGEGGSNSDANTAGGQAAASPQVQVGPGAAAQLSARSLAAVLTPGGSAAAQDPIPQSSGLPSAAATSAEPSAATSLGRDPLLDGSTGASGQQASDGPKKDDADQTGSASSNGTSSSIITGAVALPLALPASMLAPTQPASSSAGSAGGSGGTGAAAAVAGPAGAAQQAPGAATDPIGDLAILAAAAAGSGPAAASGQGAQSSASGAAAQPMAITPTPPSAAAAVSIQAVNATAGQQAASPAAAMASLAATGSGAVRAQPSGAASTTIANASQAANAASAEGTNPTTAPGTDALNAVPSGSAGAGDRGSGDASSGDGSSGGQQTPLAAATVAVTGLETHMVPAPVLAPAQQLANVIIAAAGEAQPSASPGAASAPAAPVAPQSVAPTQVLNIALAPPDLGNVTVKMRLSGGKLDLDIQVDKQDTVPLLGKDGDQLASALQSSGYTVDNLSIKAQANAGAGTQHQPDLGQGQQQQQQSQSQGQQSGSRFAAQSGQTGTGPGTSGEGGSSGRWQGQSGGEGTVYGGRGVGGDVGSQSGLAPGSLRQGGLGGDLYV